MLPAAHIHLRPCWEQSERRHWGRVTPQWYIPAQSLSDYWLTAITKSQEAPSLHHVTTTRGPKWRNCPPVTLFHPFFVAKASLEKPFIKLPVFPKASFFFSFSCWNIYLSIPYLWKFHIVIFRFPQKVLKNHVIHFVKLIRFFYQRCILKSTKETYFMFFIPSSKRSNFSLLHLLFGPIWRETNCLFLVKLNIKY